MPDTTTPNYNFVQPEIGGSKDTWGDKLNDNWEAVDTALNGIQTELSSEATNIDNLQSLIADLRSGLAEFTALLIKGNAPILRMEDLDGPVNARNMFIRNDGGDLQFVATTDAGAGLGDSIRFERNPNGFTSVDISDNGVVNARLSGQSNGTSFFNGAKVAVGATTGPGNLYAEGDVYFAREATAGSYPWQSDNLRLRDTRGLDAGVGGSICFEGQYNSSNAYAAYGWIKGYKLNNVDGDANGGLIIGSRTGPIYINTQVNAPNIDDPTAGNSVVISDNGRVGIGKAVPLSTLDVAGEIRGYILRIMDGGGDSRLTLRSENAHNTSEIIPHDEDGNPAWGSTLTFYADETTWTIQDSRTAYSANNKIMTQLDCDNKYHPKNNGEFATNSLTVKANGNKNLRFSNASGQAQAVLFWSDSDRSLRLGFYNPDGGALDVDYIFYQDGALSATQAVLTRAEGDARYLQSGDVSGFITQGQADTRYLRSDDSNADVSVTFGVITSSVSGNTAQFRAFAGDEARVYADGNLSARFFSNGDFIAQNTAQVVDLTVDTPNTLTPRSYIWANTLCLDGLTPQDVTGGRNPQTWYTNGTGRPLLVHMNGTSVSMQVRPSGGAIVDISTASTTAMAVVPPGWQYRQSTATAIQNWVEYRA